MPETRSLSPPRSCWISPGNARSAIALLREQGRVEIVHAKGTYVVERGNTSAPVPPSRRLAENLRETITSGQLKPGDPLPPSRR